MGRSAEQVVAVAPSRGFRGTVWRVHWREVAPIDWSLSLRTSGRYHRGRDLFPPDQAFPALYTSLAPEIAIWEMVRRSAMHNLAYLKNNVMSELEAHLDRMLDLSDLPALGVIAADVLGADYQFCQELAAAAIAEGNQGLLVPSAAMSGLNLVVLPSNLPQPLPFQVVRNTDLPLDRIAQEFSE